ncbi:hypothetical protein L2E82_47077 [Cichorium intybus]|uniref:Uncharacterized protein n=1 Tax=Cichorium intybus TaxID=13427 RepID=A0ACB8YUS0_CICIN|nr:hypothetical protein L2E82_47077 [Cichorium intybus]
MSAPRGVDGALWEEKDREIFYTYAVFCAESRLLAYTRGSLKITWGVYHKFMFTDEDHVDQALAEELSRLVEKKVRDGSVRSTVISLATVAPCRI